MAILSNLIVNGSARILTKLYVKDLAVAGSATFTSLSASSLSSSGTLTVAGNSTLNGNVTVAAGKTLHLLNTSGDASASADNATALIIGPRNGVHLTFDANEIIAKANGTTASQLSLNYDGGIVYLSNGGLVSVNNGTITSTTIANRGIISTEHLNVANTLRATRFDLQTISQSGGSLYISPTIKLPNANTTVVVAKSGNTLTLTITDPSITTNSIAGGIWSVNSLVKASGEFNGVASGTMDGKITGLNTSSHVLTVQVSGENSGAVAAATYNQSTLKNFSVVLYQRYVDAKTSYRVGLWLSCYDIVNNSVAIRVYGGTAVNPNAYLGNMTGASLPAVNGTTPSGWGLYADNAFLSGVIVSNAGKIGGWTLSSSSLSSGTYGSDNSTFISTVNMANHAIAGRTAADWRITAGSHFGITNTGALYCNSATITGSITATSGKIGNFIISNSDTAGQAKTTANGGHLYATSLFTHAGDENYEYEGGMKGDGNSATGERDWTLFYVRRQPKNQAWNNSTNAAWTFYVTKGGYLYASSASIEGNIIAKSGTIGGCAIESGVLKVANANITGLDASKINAGTINAARIGANTITATKLALSDPTNYIQVNESNSASAVTENHPFGGGGSDVVSGGYFSKTTATNTYLALSCYMQNSFLENDELYYSISIKGASAGTCKVGIWFYGTNGNTNDKSNVTSILGGSISFTTADKPYVGSIKITAAAAAAGYYAIGIQDTTATKVQIYCKNASMRKKNGATLIVDGAISTNQLAANAVTSAKIKAGEVKADNIAADAITTVKIKADAITSAKIAEIGGFTIDTTSIHTNGVAVTSNANNSVSLSSVDFTRTVAGASRSGLRFAIGSNFAVANTGALYASGGTIGGWSITSNTIYKNISGYRAGLYADSTATTGSGAFFIATLNSSNAITGYPFLVTYGGKLTAMNADIKGKITSGEGTIGGFTLSGSSLYSGGKTGIDVSADGVYVGTNGISLGKGLFKVTNGGALTAKSGNIGGFTISASSIYNGMSTLANTSNNGVYVGTDGIALGKGLFKVTNAGALTAKSGNIGGITINSSGISSGTIGNGSNGFSLSNLGVLKCSNADIRGSLYAHVDNNYESGWYEVGSTLNTICNELYPFIGADNVIASQSWVEGKGYATQTWVNNKGYITSSSLSSYLKNGNGTLSIVNKTSGGWSVQCLQSSQDIYVSKDICIGSNSKWVGRTINAIIDYLNDMTMTVEVPPKITF